MATAANARPARYVVRAERGCVVKIVINGLSPQSRRSAIMQHSAFQITRLKACGLPIETLVTSQVARADSHRREIVPRMM